MSVELSVSISETCLEPLRPDWQTDGKWLDFPHFEQIFPKALQNFCLSSADWSWIVGRLHRSCTFLDFSCKRILSV